MPADQRTSAAVLDVINSHVSVRRYKPDPLPRSLIEELVVAAQRASTSSNLQTYSIIAVTDGARREQLAALCANQQHIRQAPLFLAFCADLARLDRACQLRGYTQVAEYTENFLIAAVDAAIAAQNTALAAESMGLGICYIGSIRNRPREVIKLLGLPKLVFAVTGMTIGWPEQKNPQRPRLPLDAILHWDTYNTEQDATLRAYDREMAASGIYDQRQVPALGQPDTMEDYGWLEHSARRAAQIVRPELRSILEEQGLMLK